MNYELAKKLKDNGFPMKFIGISNVPQDNSVLFIDGQNAYEFPTLSELIEACGVNFEWFGKTLGGEYRVDYDDMSFIGKSSEEAVANLWLKLNKK